MDKYPGELEQLVLLAVLRLGKDAYGVTIRQELRTQTGREVSLGSIYKTLDRLERKDWLRSHVGAPTAERGGRRKRLYSLEPLGARVLKHSVKSLRNMTVGLGRKLEVL